MPRAIGTPSGYNLLRCQVENLPCKLNATVLTDKCPQELKESLKGFLTDVEWHTFFYTVKRNGTAQKLGIKAGDILLSLIPETGKLKLGTYPELTKNLQGTKPFDIYVLRRDSRRKQSSSQNAKPTRKSLKRKVSGTPDSAKKEEGQEAGPLHKKRHRERQKQEQKQSPPQSPRESNKEACKGMQKSNSGESLDGVESSMKGGSGDSSPDVSETPSRNGSTTDDSNDEIDVGNPPNTPPNSGISDEKKKRRGENTPDLLEGIENGPGEAKSPTQPSQINPPVEESSIDSKDRAETDDDNTDIMTSDEKKDGPDQTSPGGPGGAFDDHFVTPQKSSPKNLDSDETAMLGADTIVETPLAEEEDHGKTPAALERTVVDASKSAIPPTLNTHDSSSPQHPLAPPNTNPSTASVDTSAKDVAEEDAHDTNEAPSEAPTEARHEDKTTNQREPDFMVEAAPNAFMSTKDGISNAVKEILMQEEGQIRDDMAFRLMQLLEEPRAVSEFVENDGLEKCLEIVEGTTSNQMHVLAWELIDASQRWLNCNEKLISLGIHRHIVRSLDVCQKEDLFQVLICVLLSPVMGANSSLHDFVRTEGAILALLNAMHRHQSTVELIVECFRLLNRSLIHSKDAHAIKNADGLSKIAFIMDRLKDSPEAQKAGKEFIVNILGC